MRASFIHIQPLVNLVVAENVPGDFAEFGVWRGTTFFPLAEIARQTGRVIHAVDSFAGMAPPTAKDGNMYPAGCLNVGGPAVFKEIADGFPNVVQIHEGFVPAILHSSFAEDVRFAFVHLDFDHYCPTMDALHWLWPRMSPGGIIACHDYAPHGALLASGAISEWSKDAKVPISGMMSLGYCWFVRPLE